MSTPAGQTFQANLEEVRAKIGAAARRVGRDPGGVRLMAVTKTLTRDVVESAVRSGIRLFGENRVQEAAEKYRDPDPGVELHLIGHLQRNKARDAARVFSCVQSIDRAETARVLDRHCRQGGKIMDILLEVNTSGEASKAGFRDEEQLLRTLGVILEETTLRVRGLMTIGPLTPEQAPIRRAFAELRSLFDRLRGRYPELPLDTLSMGMSGDYETAVEEGSTLVRIGTALFGPRSPAAGGPA